jgi:superfamily II DNA helicase RecQ
MTFRIITIPFNEAHECFSVEDLNNFCLNKKIIRTQQEFFHKDRKFYWTVFLEYESIHENQPDNNTLNEAERLIYQRLREWRKEQAGKEGISVFIIANNKQLIEITKKRPKTLESLYQIQGIGKKKVDLYGKAIISLIKSFYYKSNE